MSVAIACVTLVMFSRCLFARQACFYSTKPKEPTFTRLANVMKKAKEANGSNKNPFPTIAASRLETKLSKSTPLSIDSLDVHHVDTENFETKLCQGVEFEHLPSLSHGLDQVVKSCHSEYHPIEELPSALSTMNRIVQPKDVNFNLLTPYVIASKDQNLNALAIREEVKYFSSTSSMTDILSLFYLHLSNDKYFSWTIPNSFQIEVCIIENVNDEQIRGSKIVRSPTSIWLRYKGPGLYAIDKEQPHEATEETILTELGKTMEKQLVMSPQQFSAYLKNYIGELPPVQKDQFNFTKFGDFLIRSQIDCKGQRSDGPFVFDLKTRAVFPIRMDVRNYERHKNFTFKSTFGGFNTWEKEYLDLLRSSLIKWSFQGRMGGMDGMFVCYHNTENPLGFQYIPLSTIHKQVFGSVRTANDSFILSMKLLEHAFQVVTRKHPEQDLRLTVSLADSDGLDVYVETKSSGFQPMVSIDGTPPNTDQLELHVYRFITESKIQDKPVLYPDISDEEVDPTIKWTVSLVYVEKNSEKEPKIKQQFIRVRDRCLNIRTDKAQWGKFQKSKLQPSESHHSQGDTSRTEGVVVGDIEDFFTRKSV